MSDRKIGKASRDRKEGSISVNGIQLYFVTKGTGSRILLCIPGGITTAQLAFGPQLEYFGGERSDFTVVSFDLRGYGHSRLANRFDESSNYYVTDAEDAHALMQALSYPSYSVLAWCGGGTAALFLAAMYPESVRDLVKWGARAYLTKEDTDRFEVFKDTEKWSPYYKVPLLEIYGERGLQERC